MNKLIAELDFTPEEIEAMTPEEVVSEISEFGGNTETLKKSFISDVEIIRGKIRSLCLYEITEGELNELKGGSQTSIYLNFAIFLISIASQE